MDPLQDLWADEVTDGLVIRPARPEDHSAVREFLEGLSPDARSLRYHSPVPVVRSWMVNAVVSSDHENREALLALAGGRIVGVAEWGRRAPGAASADVAVVVDDGFRRRGVARALLRHLAASGRAHGIESFEASVLTTNRPTLSLVKTVAPVHATRFEGETVEVTVPLRVPA